MIFVKNTYGGEGAGPPAERIPQPIPDKDNPGHVMYVFKTPLVDNNGK